jgi:hypothetical protein
MRPVFAREIGELSFLIGALVAIACITGLESVSPGSDYDGMLAFVILGGVAMGLLQGGLDRWRRDDLFFKHRPVGAIRFELARTSAGLLGVAAAAVVLIISHRYATAHWMSRELLTGWGREVRQLTPGETTLLAAALFCAWAAVRYGIARPRVWLALVLCGGLPVLCWAIASRLSTHFAAATFACAATALFVALSVIDLAGDRR